MEPEAARLHGCTAARLHCMPCLLRPSRSKPDLWPPAVSENASHGACGQKNPIRRYPPYPKASEVNRFTNRNFLGPEFGHLGFRFCLGLQLGSPWLQGPTPRPARDATGELRPEHRISDCGSKSGCMAAALTLSGAAASTIAMQCWGLGNWERPMRAQDELLLLQVARLGRPNMTLLCWSSQ